MALSKLLSVFSGGRAAASVTSPHVSPHSSRHSSFTTQRRTHSMTARPASSKPCVPSITDIPNIRGASALNRSHSLTVLAQCLDSSDHTFAQSTPPLPTTDTHKANTYAAVCQPLPLGLGGSSLRQQPAPGADTATSGSAPFASFTRVLLTSQPTSLFRSLGLQRRGRVHGPASILLALLAIFAAIMAALRSHAINKVKACKTCRGYGVLRCRVCDGKGHVDWQAKFDWHVTCCPLCFNKRMMACPDCGGLYHKPLFQHARAGPGPVVFKDAYDNDTS